MNRINFRNDFVTSEPQTLFSLTFTKPYSLYSCVLQTNYILRMKLMIMVMMMMTMATIVVLKSLTSLEVDFPIEQQILKRLHLVI